MHFVPLRYCDLDPLAKIWLPFLPAIAKRSKESVEELLSRIATGRTELALVWDGKKAHALVGIEYKQRRDELIGEIVWLTGHGMKQWTHLLPQMERYLREHKGCKVIRPICRPGWARLLKEKGYRTTHFVMEREL